ncbi:MAG: hypothetical protein JRI25_26380 [Deltaproteobacteria bacterium]|nr:hypothetical protein [Deltaproteobacteria bacterium]MBW2258106.1 hypothetical protein [Deltaproteobacteria bacterium]
MRPFPSLFALVALTLSLVACESGTSEFHTIEVSDGIASSYGLDAPGLLRTTGGHEPVWVLCGDPLAEPAEYAIDHGFGCLDDEQAGTMESRTAWIEPMPETWDGEALCALPAPEPSWAGVAIGNEVTGQDQPFYADLGDAIDPDWPQGIGDGEWRRDVSPCGGNLSVSIIIEL